MDIKFWHDLVLAKIMIPQCRTYKISIFLPNKGRPNMHPIVCNIFMPILMGLRNSTLSVWRIHCNYRKYHRSFYPTLIITCWSKHTLRGMWPWVMHVSKFLKKTTSVFVVPGSHITQSRFAYLWDAPKVSVATGAVWIIQPLKIDF